MLVYRPALSKGIFQKKWQLFLLDMEFNLSFNLYNNYLLHANNSFKVSSLANTNCNYILSKQKYNFKVVNADIT